MARSRLFLTALALGVSLYGALDFARANDTNPFLAPSTVRMVENFVFTDHEFEFRDPQLLRQLYEAGHILPLSHAQPSISRPHISAEDVQAALADNWQHVRSADGFFANLSAEKLIDDLPGEAQIAWKNHSRQGIRYGVQIITAFGDGEDANELLKLAVNHSGAASEERMIAYVSGAVGIFARTGISNADVTGLLELLEERAPRSVVEWFVLETARYGHRPAIDFLTEEIAVKRNSEGWSASFAYNALPILFSIESKASLDLALDFVDAFGQHTLATTRGEEINPRVAGLNAAFNVWDAYRYAAVFAPESLRHRLNVGLLQDRNIVRLARLFKQPGGLFEHVYGLAQEAPNNILQGFHSNSICETVAARRKAERGELADQLHNYLYQWYRHFDSREHIAQRLPNYLLEAGLSHCSISSTAISIFDWASLDNTAVRLPDYIATSARPPGYFVENYIGGGVGSFFSLDKLDHYTPRQLAEISLPPGSPFAPAIHGVQDKQRLIAEAVTDNRNYATGSDDQIMIMAPFPDDPEASEPSQVLVALRLTGAVRSTGSRALFAVALETAIHAENGLAAKISGNLDRVNELMADAGKNLVAKIQLRDGAHKTQLAFLQSTDSGQLVFQLPEGASGRSGIVDVYLHEQLGAKPISIPLFSTAGAFAHNFKGD
jgi:hypothetical protein